MKFSILVPVYNVEAFLIDCINSVLDQSYKDFEVILIDDGSTDKSSEICDSLSREYNSIRTFHKQNEGLLLARREAISFACGEYCIFLDSDDKLKNNCLEIIASFLSDNPNADLLIYNLFVWDYLQDKKTIRNSVFKSVTFFDENNMDVLREVFLLYDGLNNMVTKAVRTSLLKADNTDYSRYSSYGEDAIQSCFIFDNCKSCIYIPEPLYFYRVNMRSITKSFCDFDSIKKTLTLDATNIKRTYCKKWGLHSSEMQEKLAINTLIFIKNVFLHNYFLIIDKKQRKDFLCNDWKSLFPVDDLRYARIKKIKLSALVEIIAIIKNKFLILEFVRHLHLKRHR